MKKMTHLAVATATNLFIFKPTTLNSTCLLIAASTVGGIISDIDVTTSDSHKDLEMIILTSFISIVLAAVSEVYLNTGIFDWLKNNFVIAKNLGFLLAFLCVCFYGMHQPHRSFMHSITSVVILSGIVYFIYDKVALFFAVAMLSHIVIDLLNKRRIQLFYPFKFKFALNMCDSDGAINKILCKLASVAVVLQIAMLSVGNY